MTIFLLFLTLIVGITSGWFFAERYIALMTYEKHEFDNLFDENPHPEIYNKDGSVNRGEYVALSFDLGYKPDDFEPEDITPI